MHEQPGDRACDRPAIGGNHYGPVIIYMAAVADATTADGSDPFFKVAEYGYSPEDQLWGTDVLNEQCGRFEFTVPANLPAGDYLIRAEAIALHTASQPGAAQFYMTCYVSFKPLSYTISKRKCANDPRSKSQSPMAAAVLPLRTRSSPASTPPM